MSLSSTLCPILVLFLRFEKNRPIIWSFGICFCAHEETVFDPRSTRLVGIGALFGSCACAQRRFHDQRCLFLPQKIVLLPESACKKMLLPYTFSCSPSKWLIKHTIIRRVTRRFSAWTALFLCSQHRVAGRRMEYVRAILFSTRPIKLTFFSPLAVSLRYGTTTQDLRLFLLVICSPSA